MQKQDAVYVAYNPDGTFYVGQTTNLQARIYAHTRQNKQIVAAFPTHRYDLLENERLLAEFMRAMGTPLSNDMVCLGVMRANRVYQRKRKQSIFTCRIKELAQARGLNIASLSRVANVPIKTIRNVWHNPRYPLPMDVQERIARALSVSIRDLFEEGNE